MRRIRKRPPTSGSFKPGCKPGPGRLPRMKRNEDLLFCPIDIPMYCDPPVPEADPDDTDLHKLEKKIRYKNRSAQRTVFGYWVHTIYVPKEHVRRFIELYKSGRLRDPTFTKLEAYKELMGELKVAEWKKRG